MRVGRVLAMSADAKLQVLKSVVMRIAVLVMDGLMPFQRSPKVFRHDVSVLPSPLSGRNLDLQVPAQRTNRSDGKRALPTPCTRNPET